MMLLFFFISLIVPLASVNKASALTPQQLQDCYFYNGKTVGSLVSSTSSGNTTAPNYTFQECQDMGACQKPASNTATISCANPTQQQAVDTKLGSAITTICGPSNAIGAAYNNCVNDVTNAYNACKNASTSTAAVDGTKEQAIAACIAGKVAGVNVAKLGTALTGSAAAAATLYTNEQACIKANGQWDAAASPPTCTGGNQDANPPTCEMSPNPLSWILCPVITGLVAGVDACRSILESLLVIRVEPDSEAYNDLFKAWSNIRIIGNIILAIALLVIVFGEVVGGGVIEAYTAKKVLPRLLIGAALINLSFYIVIAFVDIMNIVGLGIYSLMSSTVTGGGLHRVNIDILGGLLGNAGIGALIVGLATGSELLVAGLMFLAVFVLLPALLIMLAVLFVVIIRQGIILVLLILSPVAFALYCLPNTEKYFKKWWEEMFKALLVFPIIMAFFAVSTILSSLLGAADLGNATPFKMIVQLIVALAPIALVVMAFKIAGGLLGNIMEVSKGLSGKAHQGILGNPNDPGSLRNKVRRDFAANAAQKNISAGGVGALFKPSSYRRKGGLKDNLSVARTVARHRYGKAGIGSEVYEAHKDDSDVTADLALHATSADSLAAIENDIAAGKYARGSAAHSRKLYASTAADRIGRTAANRTRALMNPATIGYGLAAGEEGWNQATAAMHSISRGNAAEYGMLMDEFQYVAKSAAGRADLSGNVNGGAYDGDRAYAQTSVYENANGKGSAIKGFGIHFEKSFRSGTPAGKEKAAVFYKELQAALPNSKGGTRDEILKQLEALNNAGMEAYLNSPAGTGKMEIDRSPQRDSAGNILLDRNGKEIIIPTQREETHSARLQRENKVRSYERPDLNRI